MLTLRKMSDEDIPTILQIEQLAYPFPWTHGIFKDCLDANYDCWILQSSIEIIGYGIFSSILDEAHLLNLCIHPNFQGQGFGKFLLENLMINARLLHLNTMFLEVRTSNTRAQHLYQSFGFKTIGYRKKYYANADHSEDALVYSCSL